MKKLVSLLGLLVASVTLGCATTPPNAMVKPSGDGWQCTNAYTEHCFRDEVKCKENTTFQEKGKGIYKCRPQPQAWCFTWVKDGEPDFACLANEDECTNHRKLRMILAKGEAHRGATYGEWSGCGAW